MVCNDVVLNDMTSKFETHVLLNNCAMTSMAFMDNLILLIEMLGEERM